jgi:hypothetical protein
MRAILLMVRKDLLRTLRAPLGVLLLLSFPVLFALMIGLVFGRGAVSLPRVRLLVEDRDGAIGSRLLVAALRSERVARLFELREVGREGQALMEAGEASALLRIPAGFSRDLLRGEPTALELVRNPAEGIFPEIAEQAAGVLVDVLSAGSSVFRDVRERLAALGEEQRAPTEREIERSSSRPRSRSRP